MCIEQLPSAHLFPLIVFIEFPSDVTILSGNSTDLQCVVKAPSGAAVYWELNGQRINTTNVTSELENNTCVYKETSRNEDSENSQFSIFQTNLQVRCQYTDLYYNVCIVVNLNSTGMLCECTVHCGSIRRITLTIYADPCQLSPVLYNSVLCTEKMRIIRSTFLYSPHAYSIMIVNLQRCSGCGV